MPKLITVNTDFEEITYELAGFWERFAARILDALIIIIPSFIVPILPGWLYWSLQQSSKAHATVGQSVMGIMVIGADGQEVDFGRATGRYFANLLNALTFPIGHILFFGTEKRQCLHDLVSGCAVVRKNPIDRSDDVLSHLVEPRSSEQKIFLLLICNCWKLILTIHR
ncbi:MAG: RDD family protein [Flavobacteriales bacterium]